MPHHHNAFRLGGPSFNLFDIGTSPPSPPQAPSYEDTVEFPYNSSRRKDAADASAPKGRSKDSLDLAPVEKSSSGKKSKSAPWWLGPSYKVFETGDGPSSLSRGSSGPSKSRRSAFRDGLDTSTGKFTVATECSSSLADSSLSLSEGSHVGLGAANEGAPRGGNEAPKLVCIIEGHEEMAAKGISSVQTETGSNAKPNTANVCVERSVSFSQIEIREYPRTLGDHPEVFMGPPVSMDWCYAVMDVESVDEYERNRGPRRKLGQMMMHPNVRKRMLTEAGISKGELKDAERLTRKVRRQRNWTASSDAALPIVGVVEEGVQSLRRKIKRRSWRSRDGDYYGKRS